jgi:pimeloyl-ACP methyl ester carboxylesterase
MKTMSSEIAWVSGWASDISLWENKIYEQFPSFSHRFIDYFDLLPNPDDFWEHNPRVAEAGLVVGWSMGTLALLRNLHKKAREQKWVLLCPIANFCAEGCWAPSAVRATRRGILENTEQTLMSFSALMGDVPRKEREEWVENAMRYSPKQLAQGLDYLMQTSFEFKHSEVANVELVFGEKDKVVPLAQKELFAGLVAAGGAVRVCEGAGHNFLYYSL